MVARGARLLSLFGLLGCLFGASPAAAFEAELEAYHASLDAFFAEAFAARADCTAMGEAMQRWLGTHGDSLEARADAFAKTFQEVDSEDRFAAIDGRLTALWSTITAHEGLVLIGACMGQNPAVGDAIQRFDSNGTEPVTRARDEARARLDAAVAKNRAADRDLAALAAETLGRTLSLYGATVEAYREDCSHLARALDAWHGNYFAMIDQPSKDLIAELERMNAVDKAAFAPNLRRIEAAKAATDTVAACVSQLAGVPHDRLSFQHTFMAVYVIESVLSAAR